MPFVAVSGAADRAAHFPIESAVTASLPAGTPAGVAASAWAAFRAVPRTDRKQQLSPDVLLLTVERWRRP